MIRLVVIGNSGSGKTTLARRWARERNLALLELDGIVWVEDRVAVERPREDVLRDLDRFTAANDSWIVEGCYGELAKGMLPRATGLVFMNPGRETCLTNNRQRSWEPKKHPTAESQAAMLPDLLAWVEGYYERDDAWSHAYHRKLFADFAGAKLEVDDLDDPCLALEPEIVQSLTYLGSDIARECLAADSYWPKWHGPWWHMLLLDEMGQTKRIPTVAVRGLIAALNAYPVKEFLLSPDALPPSIDYHRASPCHCQLGNVYRVLATWGLNVDAELPWVKPWLLRYQMADGGLNCDETAYAVSDECPSSMVATIAAFEALLQKTTQPWTAAQHAFLDRAAGLLVRRQLRLGCETRHNAAERTSARKWLQPCFPRFYHYDALRGLDALSLWAERTGRTLPAGAVRGVLADFEARFPDGKVRIERQAHAGSRTLLRSASGQWERSRAASEFPLLAKASELGSASPFLSRQWNRARQRIGRLRE